MRELNEVVQELLDHIPYDDTDLRYELNKYKDCENTIENWNSVGDILWKFIFCDFYPEIGWQDQVEKIWTGDADANDLYHSNF